MNSKSDKRFLVALSFAGEHREFVSLVAAQLAGELGRDRVLYDRFYVAEFARPNLDTYLQNLYQNESQLVVVFLSREYETKDWCGLEWRVVRSLINTKSEESVMLIRLSEFEVSGLSQFDGYVDAVGQSPHAIASLILERLGRFSKPILDYLVEQLHRDIELLTRDQKRILGQLKDEHRWARIRGSAGSGKTMVATEQAVRSAAANQKVLFLCHNPYLAAFVTNMTRKQATPHTQPPKVADFLGWINEIVGVPDPLDTSKFTPFSEPDDATRTAALRILSAAPALEKYDVIIVDEGQDFSDQWWKVVVKALRSRSHSFLYVFYDDNQSFRNRPGACPVKSPPLDLSRNCRNAGRVLDLMRYFASPLPRPEPQLQNQGRLILRVYRQGEGFKELRDVCADLFEQHALQDAVVLWAGAGPVEDAPVANRPFTVSGGGTWQREVTQQFDKILHVYKRKGVTFPTGASELVKMGLRRLSDEPRPTMPEPRHAASTDDTDSTIGDVLLVQSIANSFKVDRSFLHRVKDGRNRRRFHWDGSGRTLRLESAWSRKNEEGARAPVWAAHPLLFFQRGDWHSGIPPLITRTIIPHGLPGEDGSIPLHSVADFKGLEADTVILYLRGKVPLHHVMVYVGISRARAQLVVLADEEAARAFPLSFPWEHLRAERQHSNRYYD